MTKKPSIWHQIELEANDVMKDKTRAEILFRDTLLDETLRHRLERSFKRSDQIVANLFDPMLPGPLATLTQKANLAYVLGLIDKLTLEDIKNLHKIRNGFAHLEKPDFTDKNIAKACRKLSVAKGLEVTPQNYLCFYREAMIRSINIMLEILRQELDELESEKNKLENNLKKRKI
ncbi:MAG: hypothetical protein AMJ75_01850 [Phycisphaerae bacterium SM1_79]|nr:MAG: hypothetical protein AMJ75_01850 [Phycisphaerae bacterium SM1_79]